MLGKLIVFVVVVVGSGGLGFITYQMIDRGFETDAPGIVSDEPEARGGHAIDETELISTPFPQTRSAADDPRLTETADGRFTLRIAAEDAVFEYVVAADAHDHVAAAIAGLDDIAVLGWAMRADRDGNTFISAAEAAKAAE